ncbi:TSL-kinase interacting protein 1 [Striga asiatica]|uniref:TSL-kinase interacting protein 1 n=1 Tax=Striga asiatica TaxID=4170 RepID=A0A5A7PLI4_STRAF|nr:TSL-kinase interacting protein 1 [Striga asiatica]
MNKDKQHNNIERVQILSQFNQIIFLTRSATVDADEPVHGTSIDIFLVSISSRFFSVSSVVTIGVEKDSSRPVLPSRMLTTDDMLGLSAATACVQRRAKWITVIASCSLKFDSNLESTSWINPGNSCAYMGIILLVELGKTEIRYLGHKIFIEKHVRGFDVTVHDFQSRLFMQIS